MSQSLSKAVCWMSLSFVKGTQCVHVWRECRARAAGLWSAFTLRLPATSCNVVTASMSADDLHTGGYHRRLSPATHLQRLSPATIEQLAATIEGGESDVRHEHQTHRPNTSPHPHPSPDPDSYP